MRGKVAYSVPIYPGRALKSKMVANKVREKVTLSADVRRCPMTSWGRGRPLLGGTVFVRCYAVSRGIRQKREGEIGTSRTPELSSLGYLPGCRQPWRVRLVPPVPPSYRQLVGASVSVSVSSARCTPHARCALAGLCLGHHFFFFEFFKHREKK